MTQNQVDTLVSLKDLLCRNPTSQDPTLQNKPGCHERQKIFRARTPPPFPPPPPPGLPPPPLSRLEEGRDEALSLLLDPVVDAHRVWGGQRKCVRLKGLLNVRQKPEADGTLGSFSRNLKRMGPSSFSRGYLTFCG